MVRINFTKTHNTSPEVTVVITTHEKRKNDVIKNIRSIKNGTFKNFEIILIDNASTDNTVIKVKSYFPAVKIIKNSKNVGATGGKNSGIKNSSKNSSYILFLDSDFVVDKNGITELVKAISDTKRYGAATPKILLQGKRDFVQYAGSRVGLISSLNYSNSGPDDGKFDKLISIENAGGAVLVKKEVIRKVGYYDESFSPFYYEDADYSYRIKKAGFKILYVPSSRFFHKAPSNSTSVWLNNAYLTARNKIIFMKKHSISFPLFLVIYPIFPIFYLWTAIKYKRIDSAFNFFKGIFDGLRYSLNHNQLRK